MRLSTYLKQENESAADFARRANSSPSVICRLMSGQRLPSLALAERIQNATAGKVELKDWKPNARHAFVKDSIE